MALPPISDSVIVSMLQQNNRRGWKCLYDKYASILYGYILRVTSNKKIAEQILTESFIGLKDSSISTQTNKSLLPFLLHHTYTLLIKYVSPEDIILFEKKISDNKYPLISLFLFTPQSIQNVAQKIRVTETELKRNLQTECNNLHNEINLKKEYSQVKL
jgi:hypothetical protein